MMEKVYETIACIRKAFPDGIKDEEYQSLVAFLKDDFSEQNLAALLSFVNGKEVVLVQRDIDAFQHVAIKEEVIHAMKQAGYEKQV